MAQNFDLGITAIVKSTNNHQQEADLGKDEIHEELSVVLKVKNLTCAQESGNKMLTRCKENMCDLTGGTRAVIAEVRASENR